MIFTGLIFIPVATSAEVAQIKVVCNKSRNQKYAKEIPRVDVHKACKHFSVILANNIDVLKAE